MSLTPVSPDCRKTRSPAKLAVALAVAGSLVAAGCSGGSSHHTAAPSPTTTGRSAAPGNPATTGSPTAPPKANASVDPKSPLIIASTAVAQRSVSDVTELHALAKSAGKSAGIPASAIPTSAKSLSIAFKAEIAASTMLKPPAGTSAANLVSALTRYQTLSNQLASWNAAAARPMPAAFVTSLKAADATWQTALKALGQATNKDLLKNMAPLIYP
jgi:hypothetical protein